MSKNGRPPLHPSLILKRLSRSIHKFKIGSQNLCVCFFDLFGKPAFNGRSCDGQIGDENNKLSQLSLADDKLANIKKKKKIEQQLGEFVVLVTNLDGAGLSIEDKLSKQIEETNKQVLQANLEVVVASPNLLRLRKQQCALQSAVKKCFAVASHPWMSSSASYTDAV